jgi:CrcB protein
MDERPRAELPVDSDVELDRSSSRRDQLRREARWDIVLVVAVGGALGALARWGVAEAVHPDGPLTGFPWATFLVNVTGAFALGVLMVLVTERWPRTRHVRPFLGVGVLGGYTTFSTAMADTHALVDADRGVLLAAYLVATPVLGLLAVWAGLVITRRLLPTGAS